MQRRILSFLLAFCLVFSLIPAAAAADNVVTVTVTGIQDYTQAQDVVTLTNKQRSENGLEPLSHNATLCELAMQRAAEIALAFSHTRPDGSDLTDLLDGVYVGWTTAGENIAMGQSSASSVVNAWMNSEGHRANILNGDYTQIGVGCYQADGIWCWVQLFGNSSRNTAVTDRTGSGVVNFSVDTLLSNLSPIVEGSLDLKLKPGETAALRIKAENASISGYRAVLIPQLSDCSAATLTIADDGSGTITITAGNPGQAAVELPLYEGQTDPITLNITVTGETEEPEPTPSSPFTDMKTSDYFYDSVLWAVENDITNGTGNGKFSPNTSCTRGQIVTFLWRAWGKPEPESTANPFSDVKESDYFYKAVLWAVENGITTGTGNGKFSPNASCTRAQAATFLWRASGKPEPETTKNPFSDVNSGAYYYKAVLWAVENEITNGIGHGKFSPNATCTRGQIVTFLYRTLE